jgi:4-methyl-5(b-hydroxyethyl)-thiazole monophosphate biosynthesis
MSLVYVHLADGFEEVEALTVVDVLRRADIPVRMVSVGDAKAVRGAHDITVTADLLFAEADYKACDMIVLPGGMPGTANLAKHEGLAKQLAAFAQSGKWLAAICAAPTVLGKLSLLKGKRATSFPGTKDQLTGAVYSEDRVVRDGKIVTSRAAGTAMEFALELVRLLKDGQTADKVKSSMLI